MTGIVLVNHSTAVSDAQLAAWLPALQTQISRDFVPFWGVSCAAQLLLPGNNITADWVVELLDHSDIDGDLGYHFDNGVPSAKVFVGDDIRYGANVTVTLSHEILEMLADPEARRLSASGYMIEVCDPVEADEDGYLIDGVRVSNFVTPRYFGLPSVCADSRMDFRGLINGPCPTTRPGGYIEQWDGANWVQHRMRRVDGGHSYRSTRKGRSHSRNALCAP